MSEGWNAVNAALEAVRAEIAEAAPDAATAAEGDAYAVRVLTSCLADAFLGHLLTDGGLLRALPTRGGPNPDYLIAHAPVDGSRRYRLRGRMNDSERVGIGLYRFGPGGSADLAAYAAFDRENVAADGGFELEIAADAEGADALTIPPGARVLISRILHRDPLGAPARLALDGGAPGDLTLANGSTDAALAQAAQVTAHAVRQFLEWSAAASAAPNRFLTETSGLSQGVQGDPDTAYHLGYYLLDEGQWLEVTMPRGVAGYWSLHAYNHWCEALPGAGAHDLGAKPDPDGRIRIAIGPAPPAEAANRIVTAGRRRGVLICRMISAGDVGAPEAALRF